MHFDFTQIFNFTYIFKYAYVCETCSEIVIHESNFLHLPSTSPLGDVINYFHAIPVILLRTCIPLRVFTRPILN